MPDVGVLNEPSVAEHHCGSTDTLRISNPLPESQKGQLFAQPARGIAEARTKIFAEDLQCNGAPQCSVCQGAAGGLPGL